jgi:hypothetical protein
MRISRVLSARKATREVRTRSLVNRVPEIEIFRLIEGKNRTSTINRVQDFLTRIVCIAETTNTMS